ncbi:MAG: hypothetical protein IKG03_01405 [Clostridiales bacterium]|nr:hypothetical protein [Clostridiales bacterium]
MKGYGTIGRGSVRKMLAASLVAAMMLTVCSCDEDSASLATSERLPYQWLDSNLLENAGKMADADLKDDFASAINYEWLSQQTEDMTFHVSAFGEVEKNVIQNKRALLDDESFQDENIDLLRTADELFCDWEYRDSIGVEPLKKYLDFIDGIKTLDDVTAYMLDNEKNPFAFSLIKLENATYIFSDGYQVLTLQKPETTLGASGYYVNISEDSYKAKEKVEYKVKYLLDRCGYSDKEIRNVLDGCFRFESKMNDLDGMVETIDYRDVVTRDEILEMAGNYPLRDMLEHYSIDTCNAFSGYTVYVDNLEKIYTQKNVEDMKAYFKVRLALESILYLDGGAYRCFLESKIDRTNPFAELATKDPDYSFFYLIQQSSLTAAMDQAYLDYYFNQETYDEIERVLNEIREQYRILINANENLSDESKTAVLDKLDKMRFNIIRPSNMADFSGVEFKSKADGGTYLDAMCILSRIKYEHIGDMVQMKTGKSYWDIYDGKLSTTSTNSNYYRGENTIYIQMGVLGAPIYSPDDPVEVKLATYGTVLGHEMSHAFDSNNISMDADYLPTTVITEQELSKWSDAENTIINHLSTFEAFEGSGKYDASSGVSGEVIADIEGVKVCLMIAEDYEDFDYDLFFRSYAMHWRSMNSKQEQMDAIKNDHHPLMYLRVNYTLMQFEEFDAAYGIKPGDGMYLPPEQRVFVW